MIDGCNPKKFLCSLQDILLYVEKPPTPEHTEKDEIMVWQKMQQKIIGSGGSWERD